MDFRPDFLQRYLTYRLGRPIAIGAVERFARGTSRQTWFVDVVDGERGETLVFRTDLAAGSIEPTSLDQEYFMYERLGHTDVPVAEVLFWEEDPAWTETPFYSRIQ